MEQAPLDTLPPPEDPLQAVQAEATQGARSERGFTRPM